MPGGVGRKPLYHAADMKRRATFIRIQSSTYFDIMWLLYLQLGNVLTHRPNIQQGNCYL